MRALARFTKNEWDDVLPSEDEDGDKSPGCEPQLKESLVDFFRSENLVVLTGLGTSLCIKDDVLDEMLAPTMWDLWNGIRELVTPAVMDDVCEFVRQPKVPKTGTSKKKKVTREKKPVLEYKQDIELLLSKCLTSQDFQPETMIEDFIKKAESKIVELCDFLEEDTSLDIHEAFLRRIARRPTSNPRTKLFTTNYDLAFETAASRMHFVAVDGFSHTLPQSFDSSYFEYDLVRRAENGVSPAYVQNVFQLYKVHGSIDWQKNEERIVKQANPINPVLIYPRTSKFELSYESPFLDLISRFQAALRQSETSLLVIGFGFNDKHLSQPILSAIRSNVGLRTIIVSPSLEASGNAAIEQIEGLIQSGDSRLSLIAGTFEDIVKYLPDLVSETEEEKHLKRIRGEE
jgi:hypothetical protein